MTDFEHNAVKQHKVRDFVLTGAFYIATACAVSEAQAQTSTAPQNDAAQDKHKTSITHNVDVGFDNLSALTVEKNTTSFYNNFTPSVNASVEDGKGDKLSFSALELLIYDGKNITPILTTFMTELSKQLKDGSELFMRVGREGTQGGDVFPNSIARMAEIDIGNFGNQTERFVIGVKDKKGNFLELGEMWDNGTGKYIIIPNQKTADFWGKAHLSLLNRCGVSIALEAATRVGSHNQLGIASATLSTDGGLGAKILFERNFKENDHKELVRIYQNLKNSKVIGELVHAGEGQGLDIRVGLEKNKTQVFARYQTAEKAAQVGISYSFGKTKNISRRGPRDNL